MTSQAQPAAMSLPLASDALRLLRPHKHSQQGVMDTNLGGTEAAVTSQAQPAAMRLPLAWEALSVL